MSRLAGRKTLNTGGATSPAMPRFPPLDRPERLVGFAPTYVLLASSEASYVSSTVFGSVGDRAPD